MIKLVKGLSLNVGSSSQDVNGRGIIDPIDLTFEYLPIPEIKSVKDKVPTYAKLQLKNPYRLKEPNCPVHLDPEFSTYTYGHIKRGYGDVDAILKLNKGDYLFFHATLSHPTSQNLWLTAIIGYLIIESVCDCRNLTKDEITRQYSKRFMSNAHLKRTHPSVDFLISGSKKSKLFRHAILLSNFSNPLCLNEKLKHNISTVTSKQIDDGKPWHRWVLKVNDPEEVIESDKNLRKNFLHVYTMTEDSGFAPHANDEWVSLACCAGPIREYTEIGNFVLGVAGKTMKDVPEHLPLYLMQVDEKMTFNKYFHDPRFVGRVDNIYVKKGGEYDQDRRNVKDKRYNNFHKDKEDDDTKKSEFVLLSRHFYYFGNYWKNDKENKLYKEMNKLCNKKNGFTYTIGGHYKKMTTDNRRVRKFLRYIIDNYTVGKNGEPNHLPDNNQKSKCHKRAIQCQPKTKTKRRCY